ncbi:hypothetical protein [Butyribacter intestini]|uniref:hypothetical protein n=1 Tax=Butyribacter intestini TaxID=1703332 RepID=UPI0022DF345B|nr:hypothetical protein [Butyribacter intestini]
MMFAGYDTDDLTDRQNYIFHKINGTLSKINFIAACVRNNISLNQFDNYYGDCDFLTGRQLNDLGLDKEKLYE